MTNLHIVKSRFQKSYIVSLSTTVYWQTGQKSLNQMEHKTVFFISKAQKNNSFVVC